MSDSRQGFLKLIYPLLMKGGKWLNMKAASGVNTNKIVPPVSFYNLKAVLNGDSEIDFADLKGKKVLIVNTASYCGYTAQFAELKWLWDNYNDRLQIIAFPSNDFMDQEKGSDDEIGAFCKSVYRVNFPLAKKSNVLKVKSQHEVFAWLTHKEKNGWNDQPPGWNFTKYLINEQGMLTHFFDAGVSPVSQKVKAALQSL